MDIGEVESADIQTHDRLTGDPRSSGVGGGNDGWACHLLRRGWDLTRKAAIAGAAATAAPVLAPPLIVLSAAGVALSVPFAAYLASIAATNHLMDALLRSCYPPTSQPYYRQEDDDLEQEFLDASQEYGQGAPAFGHLVTETEQDEGDTLLLLLPRNHGVSEALAPAFADDEVEGEEEEGEISAQESGQESYASYRGKETELHTPVEGNEAPRGFGVSASAKPLFSHEDDLVQKMREGKFSVLDSGQLSFQPENWNATEDAVYSRHKKEDGEENKYTKEAVSQGLYFPESRVSASGGDDNVVQKRGEGEFSEQNSGQQSFQPKNWIEKEEDGKSLGENKPTNETLCVPASDDKENVDVIQEKGKEGEFSAQNLGQYSLVSSMGDRNEQGMTMKEKKSTEDMQPRDNIVSESPAPVFHGEDNVVQTKEGFQGTARGLVEEANSNTDIVMGEVAEVQVEIIAIAEPDIQVLPPSNLVAHESLADPITGEIVDAQVDIVAAVVPESVVLPLSSLAALESQAFAETAHVAEVKNEKGMAMDEKKTSEDMPRRDSVVSESSVPVLGGGGDVAQSKEGFEVAVQEEVEEANSNTDLAMGEVADVEVEIISVAAPESEVPSPIDLLAHELPADLVAGEVVDVQVDIVAAAAPGSEVLHPSNLATGESPADPVTGQIVDVEVNIVAAAETESEVLPLSSLAACESQAVAETVHVGEIVGITAMEDIVRDFDHIVKEGVSFVPVASMHDSEDVMSSGSTPYLSTVEEETFGGRVVPGREAHYTEEQLREQLDTIRTITGYSAVPSSTLEAELAGLYIFVGVEPAVGSSDTSDRLLELNAKLQFLKSIIGVD